MSESKIKKIVALVAVLFIAAIVGLGSFGTVGAGNRGVIITMGRVENRVIPPGFYWKIPFIQNVVEVDIQTHKTEVETDASSKDLQTVRTKLAFNYHLDASMVEHLYADIGLDYSDRLIVPAIVESLKQSTAKYTAEELITKREGAKAHTLQILRDRLSVRGIIVEDISITNFQFSPSFNAAIEQKVTAEQLKLKADRDLDRIKTEAEQVKQKAMGEKEAAIAKAEGEAQSIKIVSEQLKVSPQYLDWMRVNRWDGILPKVTSGAIPLISISTEK